jgi:phosphatidylglycerol:prolipoprotein diacylglycerol transferase
MVYDIAFPNLGLYFEELGSHVAVFSFDITYYGLIIALGMFKALGIVRKLAIHTNQKDDTYLDLFIYIIFFGIIGARIYYVAFNWQYYSKHLLEIINLRAGGLGVYGGLILGAIACYAYTKFEKLNTMLVFDTLCAAVPVAQGIGRWGNFFNMEAFGEYTNNLFAMRMKEILVMEQNITPLMKENIVVDNGVNYIQAHPTFLYESVGCILIGIILYFLFKKRKFDGQVAATYCILYGVLRVFIEGLRTDSLYIPYTSIRISQVVSILLIVLGLYIYWYNLSHGSKCEVDYIEKIEENK